ncbi:MAG: NAD(P)-binding domain-containing protein, partial [Candidatus Latescibacteria bacterium]|nr:NAD(P)-binding domain-containing protein [Candidatus Latescibacterota bacterium]
MRIAVLGAGSWGTSLAIVLSENGHDVALWEFDAEHATAIARKRENTKFLPGVTLPASIEVTNDLGGALRDARMVVFVVPSHATRETARRAAPFLPGGAFLVCATKGLEEGTLARMSEVLRDELRLEPGRIVSLVGPS